MALINKLSAIGEAIREKTGQEDSLTLDEMPAEIKGIVSGGVNGLPYDMGEFVPAADVQLKFGINHNLGEVPEVVVVWTDDFADLTEENPSPYSTTTNLGFIWLRGLTGLSQRLTSVATSENGIIINGSLINGEYRANFTNPMSVAYTPELPTTTQFYTPYIGNNYYWRTGVKYKYFVAKAWWNNGGAVNAE